MDEKLNSESVVNNIEKILPNLLENNNKSAKNLINKLKVNSFFNNHENKAKEKLKDLIKLSEYRHKYSKNGESLKGIIAKSYSNFKNLFYNINEDKFFLKNNLLQEEVEKLKDLRKSKETKEIKELILKIREKLTKKDKKTTKNIIKNPSPKLSKSIYINKNEQVTNVLSEKLNEEQKNLNKNFSIYKEKLKILEKFPEMGNRNFGNFEFSFYLDCLYYKKPIKTFKKRFYRRESTSLNKINRIILSKEKPQLKKKNITLGNRIRSLGDKFSKGFPIRNYRDTIDVIKNETSNNYLYGPRMNYKNNKFISLMNKGLNEPSEYDKILNTEKIKQKNIKSRNNYIVENKTNDEKIGYEDTNSYVKEFNILKEKSKELLKDGYFINKLNESTNNFKKKIKTIKKDEKHIKSLSNIFNNDSNKNKFLIPVPSFTTIHNINNTNDISTNFDLIMREKRKQLLGKTRNFNLSNNTLSINKTNTLIENNIC